MPVPDTDISGNGRKLGGHHVGEVTERSVEQSNRSVRMEEMMEHLLLAGRQSIRVELAELERREDHLNWCR